MDLSQQEITRIVEAVVQRMRTTAPEDTSGGSALPPGIFATLDEAVAAAAAAQKRINNLEFREKIIHAMRQAGARHARELAELAVEETGMGRVEDKVAKNTSQALKTPGPEAIHAEAISGDHGLTLIENAPWGVIASVTPSTNPAATVINNAISMVSAGNSVVFAPHPAAKRVSQRTIALLNEAVVAAGGPHNLLTAVAQPTIETAQQLFKYPGIGLLVVTGGEAVVHEARRQSDKRLIAAGAGNPPVVVDETADIPHAAACIVAGASFDNNIICVDEKEIIVVDCVADQLKREMALNRAVELDSRQAEAVARVILKDYPGPNPVINRKMVGRDAAVIAREAGIQVPPETRLLFTETDKSHPFARIELMMPVISVIRAANADAAIDLAVELEGGLHHTAAMHSRHIDNLHRMSREINTSIFVKNGSCLAGLGFGGEGWTSMTISTPTGEGVTCSRTFVRLRRCVIVDHFRIV